MVLPQKSTKHVARHREAVGTIRDGKIKVFDPDSGKESWRSGRSGMSADWDGEPIATNYDKQSQEVFGQDNRAPLKTKSSLGTRRSLK